MPHKLFRMQQAEYSEHAQARPVMLAIAGDSAAGKTTSPATSSLWKLRRSAVASTAASASRCPWMSETHSRRIAQESVVVPKGAAHP